MLRDLKKRGLQERLMVADGHLGFWDAVAQVLSEVEHQSCFNHKLCNVLDKLPKQELETARALLKFGGRHPDPEQSMTTTALYRRTSTAEQAGAVQFNALRRVAEARAGSARRSSSTSATAAPRRAGRPWTGSEPLLAAARSGQVLMFALDRLGRGLRNLLLLLEDFAACPCFVSGLRESIGLPTPQADSWSNCSHPSPSAS